MESRLIELIWSPPPADTHNGEIVHYIIDYTEVQTGMTSVTMSFNTTVTIGNLHPFYEYNITVSAFTVDFGPPSTSITIQTLEDGEYQSQYAFYVGMAPTPLKYRTVKAAVLCFP